jgi:hypothetical protein
LASSGLLDDQWNTPCPQNSIDISTYRHIDISGDYLDIFGAARAFTVRGGDGCGQEEPAAIESRQARAGGITGAALVHIGRARGGGACGSTSG